MYYSLADTKSFKTSDDRYVTHLATNRDRNQLAVNLSNEMIEILDSKTLKTLSQIKTLDNLNPVIKYSPQNNNHLFVSTSDSVKIFDLRHNSHKIVKEFKVLVESGVDFNELNCNQLMCFDINCDYTYLSAGTEVSEKDKNSYLYFWDIRKPALVLGTYFESHTNDITDICFDPNRRNVVATGSSDELINVLDLNEAEEDDAIMATLNVESCVERLHWTQSVDNGLICLTQEESIQLWNYEEVAPTVNMSAISSNLGFDYIIDFLPNVELVFVGDKNNSIKCFDITKNDGSTPIAFQNCLSDGHNKMVRSVAADSQQSIIYSGGEDGVVSVWNRLESSDVLIHKNQTKAKTKMRNKEKKRSNPY